MEERRRKGWEDMSNHGPIARRVDHSLHDLWLGKISDVQFKERIQGIVDEYNRRVGQGMLFQIGAATSSVLVEMGRYYKGDRFENFKKRVWRILGEIDPRIPKWSKMGKG